MLKKEMIDYIYQLLRKQAPLNNLCKDSNFSVVTALLTKDGKIYTGCNIENHGIQAICGERTVFSKALSEGETEFEAIFIVAYDKNKKEYVTSYPCGYCREFMLSYVDTNFSIYVYENEAFVKKTMRDMVPILDPKSTTEKKIEDFFLASVGMTYTGDIEDYFSLARAAMENHLNCNRMDGAILVAYNEEGITKIFTGASYADGSATILSAGKTAILKALSEGYTNLSKLLIVEEGKNAYPTYDTLQLLSGYTSSSFEIYTTIDEKLHKYTLGELLPYAFTFHE